MADKIGELNVTDISATIRGLKAIQREAKKAAQALRELEAAEQSAWTFHVGDVIECNSDYGSANYRCICADSVSAVFAWTRRTAGGWRTEYNEMFAYPNAPELRDTIAGEYRVVEVSGE